MIFDYLKVVLDSLPRDNKLKDNKSPDKDDISILSICKILKTRNKSRIEFLIKQTIYSTESDRVNFTK